MVSYVWYGRNDRVAEREWKEEVRGAVLHSVTDFLWLHSGAAKGWALITTHQLSHSQSAAASGKAQAAFNPHFYRFSP